MNRLQDEGLRDLSTEEYCPKNGCPKNGCHPFGATLSATGKTAADAKLSSGAGCCLLFDQCVFLWNVRKAVYVPYVPRTDTSLLGTEVICQSHKPSGFFGNSRPF